MRVGDGDERTGFGCAIGQVGDGFGTVKIAKMRHIRRGEISRQANRHDMPNVTIVRCVDMEFSAQKSCKTTVSKRGSVGDRVVILANEVIRQGNKIIPFSLIPAADFGWFQLAVRTGGMGVQIATAKLAGCGEKTGRHKVDLLSVGALV